VVGTITRAIPLGGLGQLFKSHPTGVNSPHLHLAGLMVRLQIHTLEDFFIMNIILSAVAGLKVHDRISIRSYKRSTDTL